MDLNHHRAEQFQRWIDEALSELRTLDRYRIAFVRASVRHRDGPREGPCRTGGAVMAGEHVISGHNPTVLANAISDAIHAAVTAGMEMDEAVSVTVAVAADYGIQSYGPNYGSLLFTVLEDRTTRALKVEGRNG